jgi:CheY-like chemotaxis protein/RNA polymerase subunit RPABC4/transcription elongation factor Spt4
MKCPKCGYETEKWGEEICPRCGGKLKVICRECGRVNEGDSEFCGGCGASLSEEEALPARLVAGRDLPEEKEGKKILIIDNDRDIIEVMKKFLEEEGHEVITAYSGPEGLKKAREMEPDLITLDLLMHLLDGFTVLEFLKKNKETKEIPVIVISCLQETEVEDKALGLGAKSYLRKPFRREAFCEEVRKYLK